MNENKPILYVIIPCYNEEEVLPETSKRLRVKYDNLIAESKISNLSKIYFVNDGSKDKTWEIIKDLHSSCMYFCGINLAHNKGHQNALIAGMLSTYKECDCLITIDADLQDDIEAIDKMVDSYIDGSDVVYGVRSSRKKDSFFKKFTAEGYYKVMQKMGVNLVFNHADYRLLSKRVVEVLAEYHEVNLFLRGIIPDIGFKSDIVYYERDKRFAGESKYPLKKMINFAIDGITSFSVQPLRFIFKTGILIFTISMIMLVIFIIQGIIHDPTIVKGWPSLICSIWALGGLQIAFLGVLGEYIGKLYIETKHRPRYAIETKLDDMSDKEE